MKNLYKHVSFLLPASAGIWVKSILHDTPKLWWVCKDESELQIVKNSIEAFCPDVLLHEYPQWDSRPYAAVSPSNHLQMQRQRIRSLLKTNMQPMVIISSLSAILQKVADDQQTDENISVIKGQSLNMDIVINHLIDSGFQKVSTVYQAGEFSLRGDVFDIFQPGEPLPYRVNLFGDDVESIHPFDPANQRRYKDIEISTLTLNCHQEILLTPQNIDTFKKNYIQYYGVERREDYYHSILDQTPLPGWEQLFPLFFEKVQPIFQVFPDIKFLVPLKNTFQSYVEEIKEAYHYRKALWDNPSVNQRKLPPIDPDVMYITDVDQDILRQPNTSVYSCFKHPEGLDVGIRPLTPLLSESVNDKLKEIVGNRKIKLIFAIYDEQDIHYITSAYKAIFNVDISIYTTWPDVIRSNAQVVLWISNIAEGFQTPEFQIVTSFEIFGPRPHLRQRKPLIHPEDIISQARALKIGDLIVHRQHGIGRYLGLETLNIYQVSHDCLVLEYAGHDKLYLPVENIELISKYSSDEGMASLDKLGSMAWKTRQLKVKKQLRTIAKYLMDIAAKRMLKTAPAIHIDQGAFEEFCREFPFVETEDQEKAITDVITDLAKGTPMDRLICGDVGFGKTEVALRAAFLAVHQGYQVGLIAPTTLLARQHYYTFKKRFEKFGYRIELISRLVPKNTADSIKEDTKIGKVSILIGTHALLKDSLKFKNLGLFIVDEEQMFGVKQKETIKHLCENVHVLTLSATPIPRTLQMSLVGLKDMSLIATPPVDRRAIHTTLFEEDSMVIHQAIQNEVNREGQVFYVYPRISGLENVYSNLKEKFPNLKITIAHGELNATEMEKRLMEFIEEKSHILLSTQIIESGIDISNANTMIIHHAHLFGLSQLYQLRGRIGRSCRQAYAYLMIPSDRTLTEKAIKRLQVMSTLDALGAGFTLASHDMDIRGAGNLLGEEQSGHIKDIGVELYQDMLKQAVNSLKKSGNLNQEEDDELWSPVLSLGLSVGLPEQYIQDMESRMDVYRRFGTLVDNDQVDTLSSELLDRFGPLPPEAENLIHTIKIKLLCRKAHIQKVESGPNGVLFTFRNNQCPYVDSLLQLIKTNPHYKLRPDSKLFYQWSLDSIKDRIRKIKSLCKAFLALYQHSD